MGKCCLALALPGFLRLLGFVTEPLLSSADIHRIEGEPARITRPVPDLEHLTVVTWNIERGQQYDSILKALRTLDADVLLLQEVDRHVRRTAYRDIARDLAHALDLNWVSGGEFQEIGEGRGKRPALTGQAILSKVPITGAEGTHLQGAGEVEVVDQSCPAAARRAHRAQGAHRRAAAL